MRRTIVERRKHRSDAIVQEILRKRRGRECPTPHYEREPWQDGLLLHELEDDIEFQLDERRAVTPLRRVARWLFLKGGMSVVLLGGLIIAGSIAAYVTAR
jgi:hypothetical protein